MLVIPSTKNYNFSSTGGLANGLNKIGTNTLTLNTANVERMRITNIGRIGIGTNNPLYDVHINKQLYVGSPTILEDLTVNGNLTVQGTTTTVNSTTIAVDDPMIRLADNNPANLMDYGFYGMYIDTGITKFGGLIKDSFDNKWHLFDGDTTEPGVTQHSVENVLLTMTSDTNYLGIGITNPQYLIDTGDTGAIRLPQGTTAERPTATDGLLRYNSQLTTFEGYSNGNWGPIGGGASDLDGDTYIQAETSVGADNDDLQFFTAGTERMHINQAGSVGIGTNAPGAGLHIYRTSTSSLKLTSTTGGSFVRIASTASVSGNGLQLIQETDGRGGINLLDNFDLYFGTNSSERMRISSTGHVGIGTNNPSENLHVYENVNGGGSKILIENPNTGTSTFAELYITDGGDDVNDGLRLVRLGTNFTTNGGFVQNGATISADTNVSGGLSLIARHTSGDMRFYTGGYANSNERMRINSSGNVGIGTNNPNWLLHSHKSDSTANYLQFTNSSTGNGILDGFVLGIDSSERVILYNGNNTDMYFATNSIERMRINSSGNVGIGTNNPGHKLEVEGGNIMINTDDQFLGWGDESTLIQGNSSSDYLRFYTASTERLRIDSSGNVGIGTNNPGDLLHIHSTSGNTYTQYSNSGGGSMDVGLDGSENGTIVVRTADNLNLMTNNALRLQIDSAGNREWKTGIKTKTYSFTHSNVYHYIIFTNPGKSFTVRAYANNNALLGSGYAFNGEWKVGYRDSLSGNTHKITQTFYREDGGGPGADYEWWLNGDNLMFLIREDQTNGFNVSVIVECGNTTTLPTSFTGTDVDPTGGYTQQDYVASLVQRSDGALYLGTGVANQQSTVPNARLEISGSTNDTYISLGNTLSKNKFALWNSGGDSIGMGIQGSEFGFYLDASANKYTFYDDEAWTNDLMTILGTGNVGIGTTNPNQTFHVYGNAAFGDGVTGSAVGIGTTAPATSTFHGSGDTCLHIHSQSGNRGAGIRCSVDNSSSGGLMIGVKNANNPVIRDISGQGIAFETNGANERMRIDESGFVGIGTTNPNTMLHLYNATGAPTIRLTSGTSNNSSIHFGDTGDVDEGRIYYNTGGQFMGFYTNGSERLLINSTGNVGIGTNNPASALHIANNAFVEVDKTLLTLLNGNATGEMNAGVSTNNSTNIDFVFQDSNANFTPQARIKALLGEDPDNGQDAEGSGNLSFWTSKGSGAGGTLSEIMRLTYEGNVGIGTTNPLTKLHVYTGANDGIKVSNSVNGNYIDILSFQDSGADETGMNIYNATTTSNFNIGTNPNANEHFIYTNGAYPLVFSTNGTERLRINNSGNVGIGTNSPGAKLDVNGTVNIRSIMDVVQTADPRTASFRRGDSNIGGINIQNSTTGTGFANGLALQVDSDESARIWNYENTVMRFATNNAERMRIDTSGNVGIGTQSSTYKLRVEGTAYVSSNLSAASLTSNNNISITGGNSRVEFSNNQDWGFQSNWEQAVIRFDNDNNSSIKGILKFIDNGSEFCRISNEDGANGSFFETKNTTIDFHYEMWDGYGFGVNGSTTRYNVPNTGAVHRFYGGSTQFGYVDNGSGFVNTFTGQHRPASNPEVFDINKDNVDKYVGLIVVSTGVYMSILHEAVKGQDAITINEALPEIDLCKTDNDKKVFGVVSDAEDPNDEYREDKYGAFTATLDKIKGDNRLFVNSVGEGAMWVCDINGNLENGDYITSCTVPGYGKLQDDDLLHNYTVAKITCDCDFNPPLIKKQKIVYDIEIVEKERKATTEIKTRPKVKRKQVLNEETGKLREITYEDENDLQEYQDHIEVEVEYIGPDNKIHTKMTNKIEKYTEEIKHVRLDEDGRPVWEDVLDENNQPIYEPKYKLRYVDSNGNELTLEEYNTKKSNGENVYKCAFIGCTYHCA